MPGPTERPPLATLLPATTGDWAARCAHTDTPDNWFPTTLKELNAARDECGQCPLVLSCLAYGLTAKMTGVWGGRLLENGHDRYMTGDRTRTRTAC
ncbi:WhiB family transcriptional regulator [Prescottella subtropica]|uniref:WhiB family transcriptional regulator n=1 Tax=Prescottella subtropica TaxID=2545757 RepID=UPI0010F73608|nr:WhiB family transcriptional regulator [Prescottella subtropica]